MKVEDENGDEIGGVRPGLEGVDLDGVPGGLQPEGKVTLPGQTNR